jgi:hypothetical protein
MGCSVIFSGCSVKQSDGVIIPVNPNTYNFTIKWMGVNVDFREPMKQSFC